MSLNDKNWSHTQYSEASKYLGNFFYTVYDLSAQAKQWIDDFNFRFEHSEH